jgi:hypothetical protein
VHKRCPAGVCNIHAPHSETGAHQEVLA